MMGCFLLHKIHNGKKFGNNLRIAFSHLNYLLCHFLVFFQITGAYLVNFTNLRFELSQIFIKHLHEIQDFTMHPIDFGLFI